MFDEHVIVDREDLSLRNVSAAGSSVNLDGSEFDYDAATTTGTWDFTRVMGITPAWYSVSLLATDVTDMTGLELDGNGNGDGGDNYDFTLLVAKAGDTDLDGNVDISDAYTLITSFDSYGTNPANNWSTGDFDHDTDIDVIGFTSVAVNFRPGGYATMLPNVTASDDKLDSSSTQSDRLMSKLLKPMWSIGRLSILARTKRVIPLWMIRNSSGAFDDVYIMLRP